MLGVAVLGIAVPVGVGLGLTAGYLGGRVEMIIMRVTDIFLAIPSLVLAMAILGLFEPDLLMAMVAVSAGWWPWYTRLIYSQTRSIRVEGYVTAARIVGASPLRIIIGEILPNCMGTILTKMTLDMGMVILVGSSLSFSRARRPTADPGSRHDGGRGVHNTFRPIGGYRCSPGWRFFWSYLGSTSWATV